MKIVRSWPEKVPKDRCYVVDTLPRVVMTDYDYRCLGEIDDDILLIEWDMAVSKEDLELFVDHIRAEPSRVLVAPYRLYMPTKRQAQRPKPVWAHRRFDSTPDQGARFVEEGEPFCHKFGLGMTYLPRELIRAFLADWPGHFSDGSFSGWHYRNVAEDVPIAWDVRPIHLHYLINQIGR